MNPRLIALLTTVTALLEAGFWGILAPHFQSWAGAQVFTELVLACLWMVHDAKRHALPAWPFVALTLAAGPFGPLLYLAARELQMRKDN